MIQRCHKSVPELPCFSNQSRKCAIPSRQKLLQRNSLQRKCFGAINFVKITKESLYKANSLACFLAKRDTPVAATLQRKSSGGINFVIITKIIFLRNIFLVRILQENPWNSYKITPLFFLHPSFPFSPPCPPHSSPLGPQNYYVQWRKGLGSPHRKRKLISCKNGLQEKASHRFLQTPLVNPLVFTMHVVCTLLKRGLARIDG